MRNFIYKKQKSWKYEIGDTKKSAVWKFLDWFGWVKIQISVYLTASNLKFLKIHSCATAYILGFSIRIQKSSSIPLQLCYLQRLVNSTFSC